MSKKKHRRKREENNNSDNNNNNIMDLLNNIDEDQISSLLSNFNLGNLGNLGNMNNSGINNNNINLNNVEKDETLQLLYAIKPMVNAERGAIIEKIIQLYSIGRMLKK
ncbi:hypothetical protein GCM10008905_04250 [Clostridium malenominatum]|uniref:Uncharacterized protein n=1 Tax=Clostridium malenominatum TaxID=1539 RepID=A0ABP3TU38_9CLOT